MLGAIARKSQYGENQAISNQQANQSHSDCRGVGFPPQADGKDEAHYPQAKCSNKRYGNPSHLSHELPLAARQMKDLQVLPTAEEQLGRAEFGLAWHLHQRRRTEAAEKHFRRAVEKHPRDAEAWLGLAASYDRLRRFDLADRAYAQAVRILGPTVEILNNQGYSYMLRGDYKRAHAALAAAQRKDPTNKYVQNNLRLLEESYRKGKAIQ